MKRIISALLIVAMFALAAACAAKPSEPTATAKEAVEPGTKLYSPMDIFSDEFNPFAATGDSPFTVADASFNKGGKENSFTLLMTGGGNMLDCISYQADLAGLGLDEAGKLKILDELIKNGHVWFSPEEGIYFNGDRANPNDDRYEYVEADGSHGISGPGCVFNLMYHNFSDDDLKKYTQLVRDNFNMEALSLVSDYMNVETDFAECGIVVNLHKDHADTFVVYHFPDIEAIRKNIAANVKSDWWEWYGNMETIIEYKNMGIKLTFNNEEGTITISQGIKNISAAEGSLAALGFDFDDAGVCGVYNEHEPHYMDVAISRPEWGEFNEGWNFEFADSDVNGYGIIIWYYVNEKKYEIQIDGNGKDAKYEYFVSTGKYNDCASDPETLRKMFNAAFGTKGEAFRKKPIEYMEQEIQNRFGMSVMKLYNRPKR